jgi:hypothetical protein
MLRPLPGLSIMKPTALVVVAVTATLLAHTALAHHSFAMFDHKKIQTLEGTVKEFEYINPHSWVHITVAAAGGRQTQWSFEMGGVGQLTRDGWTRNTVKPGDKVSVSFHPLFDGSHGGQFLTVTFTDTGKTICQMGAGNAPCKVGDDHSTNLNIAQ